MKMWLILAPLLALVTVDARAAPEQARPAPELRCLYDEASESTRDEIGLAFWATERSRPTVAAMLGDIIGRCRDRHQWEATQLLLAGRYVQGMSILQYARRRFAAMQVRTSRFDEIYQSIPVDERTQRESERAMRAFIAEIIGHPAAYAGDPEIQEHAALYLFALRYTEQSERMWAGLMPVSWPGSGPPPPARR